METGGLYVMMGGEQLMLMLPADNLVTLAQVGDNSIQWQHQIQHLLLADATAYSNAHFGENADIIIALDDLACTTAQTRLIDCTRDTNTGDCSHSDDAGVQCVACEFLLQLAIQLS